jgi:small GTP-binding protein
LRKLLSAEQDSIVKDERVLLQSLRLSLAKLDVEGKDMQVLGDSLRQIEELFLLVVVGEFNAGKSAFINALLGDTLLPEGVTPTTTQIQILRYGGERGQGWEGEMAVWTYPLDWLADINIVDTPGTNAVIQRHQELTEDFVPRSDLVLFITSADRPFSESERAFMERIRDWGKKVVVVVNKVDILRSQADLDKVVSFVNQNAQALLGVAPRVFPVSARLALQAKQAAEEGERQALWAASRFDPLERYILSTLDETERIRLKLDSPLGVVVRLSDRYLETAHHRLRLLRDDYATIDALENQLSAYEADMRRDFTYHLSHVDNVLYEMLVRGNDFFDDIVRFRHVLDLLNAERVRGDFERRVVADTVSQVDAHVSDLVDWMVDKDLKQWQAVMEYLGRGSTPRKAGMVGQIGGRFERSRHELLASVGRAAAQVVHSYDKEKEALHLAESIQSAVAQAALLQVGAIGLGAILVKLLATALADVTGVLAAGVVAAVGLYLIPARRRRAKKDLQQTIDDLRRRLSKALTTQFEHELGQSLQRIRDAVAPYTRFVRAEQEQVQRLEVELLAARSTARSLRLRVQRL